MEKKTNALETKVLGISGSPVKDSNLDRLIQLVLKETGFDSEFIKLSDRNIFPCRACLKCAVKNRCVQKDDWHKIGEKMLSARAIIIGGYTTYGAMDGWTKILFERMFSFRHQRNVLKGKFGVAVGIGYKCEKLGYSGPPSADIVADSIGNILKGYGLNVIGKISARGNPPCLSCGFGETCPYSNVLHIWGKDAKVTPDKYNAVENQPEVMDRARQLGRQINGLLT